MVLDPISDMLTRIRNAVTKKHKNVLIPSSKFKVEIAKILQNEGFINSFKIIKNGTFPSIKIDLKYDSRKSPVIKKIKRISKPGLRVYVNKNEIPRISGGLGTSIFSTSRGVMTGIKAREIAINTLNIFFIFLSLPNQSLIIEIVSIIIKKLMNLYFSMTFNKLKL